VADGVMVARGDLGVEMSPEKVPIVQKQVIRRAGAWRKPVITATQMLESMIDHPRPTRAEASDVANAVFDGTDAVMLSAETASGKYPREAVTMMTRIVMEAEAHLREAPVSRRRDHRQLSIAETICESVAHAAEDLEMMAVAVYTESGTTARLISKYRPRCPIYAFTHVNAVCNRMNLFWGVRPVCCELVRSGDEMVRGAEQELLRHGALPGSIVGVVAGTRHTSGATNFMRLHVIGAARPPEHPVRPKPGGRRK
jgi:pyruvate kinase